LNDGSWTLDAEWQIGPAVASSSGAAVGNPDPAVDGSGVTGGGVAGVVIGGSPSLTPHPYRYLTSPLIRVSRGGSLFLEYDRWLNTASAPQMVNVVEAFDGIVWQKVWESDVNTVHDGSWRRIAHDVTPFVNPGLRVRFGFSVGAGSAGATSWNLDRVALNFRTLGPGLLLYRPSGEGSLAISNLGCTPTGSGFTILTLNTAEFGQGWFFGVAPSLNEIVVQTTLGPPFTNVFDFGGGTFFTAGFFVPGGISLAAVTLDLGSSAYSLRSSPPVLYTT
jgi:hypothetical protein